MAMTPLPTPPSTSDPATFAARADAFVAALALFQAEANGLSSTAVTLTGGLMTAPLGFSVGAVGAPSGYGSGDTNTGFWFPAADTVAFSVGGVEKWRINVTSGVINVGTTTNNSAASGVVGEYLETVVLVGSAVSLANGVVANIATLSLTAGDWDVNGVVTFTGNAATVVTRYLAGISQTSATAPTHGKTDRNDQTLPGGSTPFSTSDLDGLCGPTRISLAGTTTIYLVALALFSVNTCAGYGQIMARRVR